MGVTCHRQYISIDDLRDDTIDDWKIIDQDDDSDIILIECSVSDAPTLILEGLFGKINQ